MSSASRYLPTAEDWEQILANGTSPDVKQEEAQTGAQIAPLGTQSQMGSTDGQPQASPHELATPLATPSLASPSIYSLDSQFSHASPASTGTSPSVTSSEYATGMLNVLGFDKDLPRYSQDQYPGLDFRVARESAQYLHEHPLYQPHIQQAYTSTSHSQPSSSGSGMHMGLQQLGHFDQPQYRLPSLPPARSVTDPTDQPDTLLSPDNSFVSLPSAPSTHPQQLSPPLPVGSGNTANISFQPTPHHRAVAAGVVVNGNSSALNTPRTGPTATPATPVTMPPNEIAPPGSLLSPPEAIYASFDELIGSIQRVAKEQGYGIVKLRASNYRDSKPTRYDLVCDRGGVKYNSTAKKRNPSTRKVDCPWRAKAVSEVSIDNRWRFSVQNDKHNHEPRLQSGTPGQDTTPTAQSIRTLTNKLDRMNHDLVQTMQRLEEHLNRIEKKVDDMDAHLHAVDNRLASLESRGAGMDVPMDNMEMGGAMLDGPVM
ncbi:hypothetical protein F5B19DRAFT_156157 [Rostrohypoxylon terebratum]|nr:hypothetical protein F5B19DRAFT_156157 [Rostrohypoxylon terebratum]